MPDPTSGKGGRPGRPDGDEVDDGVEDLTGRHEARERALHLLYEASTRGTTPAEVLAALPVQPDEYAVDIVSGVGERIEELDELIAGSARGWTLERMPTLDLAVLRLAAFELAYRNDVPLAVVIDEAVELAKTYSTDESGGFVNGVLSAIARTVR